MTKQSKKTLRISGKVVDRHTQLGLPGLRIEAWDKDLIFDDLLGSAVSNPRGQFIIEYDENSFRELFFDREPDIFFKVFRNNNLVKSTEDSVLWNVKTSAIEKTIEVDLPEINSPTIR